MPRLDRTGPEGKGSRTGRVMGKCNSQIGDSAESPEENRFFGGRRAGRENETGEQSGKRFRMGLGRGKGKGMRGKA